METNHPEMSGQIGKIENTLSSPDIIVRSKIDPEVELFYKHYRATPVTDKYLCVVVKVLTQDLFIITAYFTDTMVAVGTILSDGPPHRSQRALLTHWAPTSGVWRRSAHLDKDV